MGKDQHLLEAARNGQIEIVGKLLELNTRRFGPLTSFRRGPNINCQDVNGYTALHHACLNGRSSIVRLLLSHNAQIDVPDIRGSTPLFLASWAGHQEIVRMLLTHSPVPANPNAQTIENETPLHSSAQHGHNTVVAMLLSHYGDPSIRNNSFQTALDLAAQFGRLQVVQTLLRASPELIALYRHYQEYVSIPELLDCITPSKHIFTHTCLHLASRNGHKKVVETLLAAGVDVNILTHAGSALHEAALCGKKSVVVALLKAGIDIDATDGNGRTALDILADYPPHVTYDIVAVINEFKRLAESQLLPVLPQRAQMGVMESPGGGNSSSGGGGGGSSSLPRRLFEKNLQRQLQKQSKLHDQSKQRKKQTPNIGLSHSLSSLNNYTRPPSNYLEMKPISQSVESCADYQPVYKQPYQGALLFKSSNNFSSNSLIPSRSYEYINLLKNVSSSDEEMEVETETELDRSTGSSNNTNRSAPDSPYVQMSIESPPVPLPRKHLNVHLPQFVPRELCITDMDTNNNNNSSKLNCHSPTPDYPPPTVNEAEATIYNYMQPRLTINSSTGTGTSTGTTNSSYCSDHVEEFVGDMPFAGLFKGSTLNLSLDTVDGRGASLAREVGLRSPSMVRSVHAAANKRRSLSTQRYSATGEDFSASRVFAEIDTIFEHIGNELTVEKQQDQQEQEQDDDDDDDEHDYENLRPQSKQEKVLPPKEPSIDRRQSLHIRNPAELLLDNSQSPASNWCHSPYTLVYGEIRYTVYYLGSTVIRHLQGTISARKSIQKLKIEERCRGNISDMNLLENCNTSTKYLKAANLQTRLKVDIAASCLGVKFIDHDKKTAICSHDIENINCVCQDAEDMRYFAYLTKEQDLHYCHVFMVDNLELANEIILTLGQAFEVAYQLALSRQSSQAEATAESLLITEEEEC